MARDSQALIQSCNHNHNQRNQSAAEWRRQMTKRANKLSGRATGVFKPFQGELHY